jgi:predicted ribosomally synthesized peptide with SipW-like signal peptide
MKQAFRNWFLFVTAIAALLSLTAATYAWFTSNQEVSTTRASARTAEESLELQISSDGSTFSNASPVAIAQVNQNSLTNLLPVSTADLTNFYKPYIEKSRWMDQTRK